MNKELEKSQERVMVNILIQDLTNLRHPEDLDTDLKSYAKV